MSRKDTDDIFRRYDKLMTDRAQQPPARDAADTAKQSKRSGR